MELKRNCPECGSEITYKTENALKIASSKVSKCRSCSRKKPPWEKLLSKAKALHRKRVEKGRLNFEFNLTAEYLHGLWDGQLINQSLGGDNILCKLSGQVLDFKDVSVDRIDSSIGYVMGNIQLVHKYINIGKNEYDEQVYVMQSVKVADHFNYLNNNKTLSNSLLNKE